MHATKIVAAVLDAETGELRWFRVGGDVREAAGLCAGLPRPVRAAYEAGPTGYGLARELARRDVACVVAAPSKIPRASGDRVKTDRRDAELLVRLLLAGKLHAVRVPGRREEALRDLVRAREAVRVDLMRCRHRISKLLLRHGVRLRTARVDGPPSRLAGRHRIRLAGGPGDLRGRVRRGRYDRGVLKLPTELLRHDHRDRAGPGHDHLTRAGSESARDHNPDRHVQPGPVPKRSIRAWFVA